MCTHTERVAKIGRQRESERCGIRQIWNKKLRKTDRHEERQGSGDERDNEIKVRSYKGRRSDIQITRKKKILKVSKIPRGLKFNMIFIINIK